MVDFPSNLSLSILQTYRADYSASYHARGLARLLHKNHATLLPHLHSLEKKRILNKTTQGKNTLYSINKHNSLTKHFLLLTETHHTITYLETYFLIKKLCETFQTDATIILFGSYAKETFDEQSDIDLLIIGRLSDQERATIEQFASTYGKRLDLKSATIEQFADGLEEKDPLVHEVVKNHVLLHRPERFIDLLWSSHQ